MLEDLVQLALVDAASVFGSFTLLWAIGLVMRDSSLVDIWFAPCIALAPFMVAQTAPEPVRLGMPARIGAALTLFGVLFQGVAYWQLARFKREPASAGQVLDSGLWRYSRHPNYFGESCVWWGYWLIACEVPWSWVTVFAPAFMTWSILGMMGKELVERRMLKKRPGYEDYVARTSGFVPWFPRRPKVG